MKQQFDISNAKDYEIFNFRKTGITNSIVSHS